MAKHTPGPWEYDYGIVPPDGPEKYSDIYVIGDDREPIIIAEFNNCIPEGQANARLIAAAPDLLEALKWLHELCIHANPGAFDNGNLDATGSIDEGDVLASKLIGGAQSAIAKAESR